MSKNKAVAGGVFLVLVFGVMLGRLGSGTPPTEVRTVYKDRPVVTTTTVNRIPESCSRAIDMAVTVRDTAGKFDTVSAPQSDLMSKAVEYIADKDWKSLNKLIDQQKKLRTDTMDAADTLQGRLYVYNQILTKCKGDLK